MSIKIDYVRYNFKLNARTTLFSSIFHGLSDNSNYATKEIFGFIFDVNYISSKGRNILIFSYSGVPVFEFKQYTGDFLSTVDFAFTFYGSFFCFPDLLAFHNEFYKKYYSDITVSRCDLCLDLFNVKMSDVLGELVITDKAKYFTKVQTSFKKFSLFGHNENFETVYFGSKTNNDRYFIRVYDKLEDIKTKRKARLYKDYFQFENVTRIELQLNLQTIKRFEVKPSDINELLSGGNNTSLHKLFSSLLRSNKANNFEYLENVLILGVDPPKVPVMPEHEFLDKYDYALRTYNYAKKLHDEGFDILSYLEVRLKQKASTVDDLPF